MKPWAQFEWRVWADAERQDWVSATAPQTKAPQIHAITRRRRRAIGAFPARLSRSASSLPLTLPGVSLLMKGGPSR